MNTSSQKVNTPPGYKNMCSNPIPVNQAKNFKDGTPVTPYVIDREPRIFDGLIVEILTMITHPDFNACKASAMMYLSDIINSIIEKCNELHDAKHPDRPEPVTWNMTQSEIDELHKPPEVKK